MTKYLVLYLFSLWFCGIREISSDVCTKFNSCTCVASNYEISLSSLASKDPSKPRFDDIHGKTNDTNGTFAYNPCYSFHKGNNVDKGSCGQSNGVAVCLYDGIVYSSLGTQDSAQFTFNSTVLQQQLDYSDGNKVTSIILKCVTDPEVADLNVDHVEITSDKTHYFMTLSTRCACPNGCMKIESDDTGLSFGSVFFILVAIVLSGYLGGGMLFLYYVRGARGWEIIPHYEFWLDFPLLVKDGCVFVFNCCRTENIYNRI